jgi:hypothetical protein
MEFSKDIHKLIMLIKSHEPKFSADEKAEMWNNITSANHIYRRNRWLRYAAAIAVLVVVGSSVLYLYNYSAADSLAQLSQIDLQKTQKTCMIIGETRLEIDNHSVIKCMPGQGCLNITHDESSYSVSCNDEKQNIIIAVPEHEQTEIRLSDGSSIIMRGGSKMVFPYDISRQTRTVAIDGEAYMKIHHDEKRPFTAHSQKIDVNVLGTEFLMSVYGTHTSQNVTLINGLVEVKTENGQKVRINPNQTFAYNTITMSSRVRMEQKPEEMIAWKDELLVLDNKQLSSLLKQLENIYGAKFDYDISQIANIRLKGKIDISVPLDNVMSNLERTEQQLYYKP